MCGLAAEATGPSGALSPCEMHAPWRSLPGRRRRCVAWKPGPRAEGIGEWGAALTGLWALRRLCKGRGVDKTSRLLCSCERALEKAWDEDAVLASSASTRNTHLPDGRRRPFSPAPTRGVP